MILCESGSDCTKMFDIEKVCIHCKIVHESDYICQSCVFALRKRYHYLDDIIAAPKQRVVESGSDVGSGLFLDRRNFFSFIQCNRKIPAYADSISRRRTRRGKGCEYFRER